MLHSDVCDACAARTASRAACSGKRWRPCQVRHRHTFQAESQSGSALLWVDVCAGYWRLTNESREFFRCYVPSHCDGGRTGTCTLNRDGPVCALCKVGRVVCRRCLCVSCAVACWMLLLMRAERAQSCAATPFTLWFFPFWFSLAARVPRRVGDLRLPAVPLGVAGGRRGLRHLRRARARRPRTVSDIVVWMNVACSLGCCLPRCY